MITLVIMGSWLGSSGIYESEIWKAGISDVESTSPRAILVPASPRQYIRYQGQIGAEMRVVYLDENGMEIPKPVNPR